MVRRESGWGGETFVWDQALKRKVGVDYGVPWGGGGGEMRVSLALNKTCMCPAGFWAWKSNVVVRESWLKLVE